MLAGHARPSMCVAYLKVELDLLDRVVEELGEDNPGGIVKDDLWLAELGIDPVHAANKGVAVRDIDDVRLDRDGMTDRRFHGRLLELQLFMAPGYESNLAVTLSRKEAGDASANARAGAYHNNGPVGSSHGKFLCRFSEPMWNRTDIWGKGVEDCYEVEIRQGIDAQTSLSTHYK